MSWNKSSLLIILIYLSTLLWLHMFATCLDEDDSIAMAELASALYPNPNGWFANSSTTFCSWNGVICDRKKKHVTGIQLGSMKLSGSLPSKFPFFPHLKELDLSNNSFTGPIPSLANLTSLENLFLDYNNFTRISLEFFHGLPNSLMSFVVSQNPFLSPWTIPLELTKLSNFSHFSADNTNIEGTLPEIFSSCPINFLSLTHNNLRGPLPVSLRGSPMVNLYLNHQKPGLSGNLEILSDITYLSYVHLQGNQFTGKFPHLSHFRSLRILLLDGNKLTGVIPQQYQASNKLLTQVSVSNNFLQGPFPSSLLKKSGSTSSDLKGNNFCTMDGKNCSKDVTTLLEIASAHGFPLKLSKAWRGDDACKGWDFITCNSQKDIVKVDFGKQHLGGSISPSMGSLQKLQYLYLNDNSLTGSIPSGLANLRDLKVLDVSNNNISGHIPVFRSSVKLIIDGNQHLRKQETNIPSTKGKMKVTRPIVITIVTIITIITIIAGSICTCLIARKRAAVKCIGKEGRNDHTWTWTESQGSKKQLDSLIRQKIQAKLKDTPIFDFQKLINATNNFHLDNKIGEGGFGPVYQGRMEDGEEIAVKRLSYGSGQGIEEFVNEVVMFSTLEHRNLVKFLGCCITLKENILVYELMSNGSLDKFLFDPEKRKLLDWGKRFNIIKGVGRGLLYLHKDSRLRIIHRDLKTSNILLDEEFNPKISDLGMARAFSTKQVQAMTRRVVGTFGYMPREYVIEGRFSDKSDVYSFGVLMLEIVSGRRNTTCSNDEHGLSLLEHAWKLWEEGNTWKLVDDSIHDPIFLQEIAWCVQVALLCVQDSVKDRPTTSNIVSIFTNEDKDLPHPKPPMFIDWEASQVTIHTSSQGSKADF